LFIFQRVRLVLAFRYERFVLKLLQGVRL